ncbi:hypothetical protein LCGC14_1511430, partial [marine sediment metagenome]
MAERTVAELIAFARAAQVKTAQAASSWIKPAPIYPTNIPGGVTSAGNDASALHVAIDLPATMNSPIKSLYSGVVEKVIESNTGYGNNIIIRLPDGYRVRYSHLNAFGVQEGQAVRAGQVIGLAGSSGNSSGPHLDLSFRTPSGTLINPYDYMAEDFRTSKFKGPGGRAEYGASEMIGRQITEGPSQKLIVWPIPGMEAAFEAGQETAGLLVGSKEDGELKILERLFEKWFGKTEEKEPGDITILKTPIGDVNLPGLPSDLDDPRAGPWLRIAAVGLGLVLVWIAVIALMRPM